MTGPVRMAENLAAAGLASSVRPSVLATLEASLASGQCTTDPDALEAHAGDASSAVPVRPVAVVHARSVEDVQATLVWASEHGVPVTPRGTGTGKAGGCIPQAGGVVLSLAGMAGITSVQPEHGFAEVEPGVVTGPFRDTMEQDFGLFYPPDPNSLDRCTLGGNVATNAGGPVALKYGVTGRYVMGLTAVLANGTVIDTGRRQPKGVAGYDLRGLLVGSEGTLAVLVGLRLGLLPRPRAVISALMPFASLDAAARAVARSRQQGLLPRALELVDGVTLSRVRPHAAFPVDPSWGALLLAEFDGEPGTPERDLERFVDGLEGAGPDQVRIAADSAERTALWEMRRQMSKLVKIGTLGHISEDIAVPVGSIPTLVQRLQRVAEQHRLIVATYGHAGDGNLHVNILWEELTGAERAEDAAEAVMREALELGGTISGEHGIGLLKRRFLPLEQTSPVLSLQRALKSQWDPVGILNPGKIFA